MNVRRRVAAIGTATALMLGATVAIGATAANAADAYFRTLQQCQAATPLYNNSFTRVTKGCTYSKYAFPPTPNGTLPGGWVLEYKSR